MSAKGKNKARASLQNEKRKRRQDNSGRGVSQTGDWEAANEQSRWADRTLSGFRGLARLRSQYTDREKFLQTACGSLMETQKYHGAWIAARDGGGAWTMVGKGVGSTASQRQSRELPAFGATALAQEHVCVEEDPWEGCADGPNSGAATDDGAMGARLECGANTIAVLMVYAPRPVIRNPEERALFQELASHLAMELASFLGERARRVNEVCARAVEAFGKSPGAEVYQRVLEILLEATHSVDGVFGYLDESGAYVVPDTAAKPGDVAGAKVFPRDTWGNAPGQCALREMRSIWSNEPFTWAPGHILELRRQISVPVISAGEVLGLIQVANKEDDYHADDVVLLEQSAAAIAPALAERLRRERQALAWIRSDEAHRAARRELEAYLRKQALELGNVRQHLHEESAKRAVAEDRSRRHGLLAQSIGVVFQDVLACEDDDEVARVCLSHARRMTGSPYGYFARMNAQERFDVIALGSQGEAGSSSDPESVARAENIEIRGIWGKVLRGREPYVINGLDASSDRAGVLEGSPPLTAFLSVPLQISGAYAGAIALANKAAGYDDTDLDVVEALARLFAAAVRYQKAEAALRETRRELGRRDSLVMLGQLGGKLDSKSVRTPEPVRRKLLLWFKRSRAGTTSSAYSGGNGTSGRPGFAVLVASSRQAFLDAVRPALVGEETVAALESADLDEQGIKIARGSQPDVIVVDLSAAGMSGFRTVAKIREQAPGARIIAVSPIDSKSIKYTARECGAHRLLLGDFQGRDLVETIRGLMSTR